ncbi:MAG: L-serine ammonia-lyase [Micrococcales bacterium]|nr:L-serine ammonia-lyase [Micrococcales bacterium]
MYVSVLDLFTIGLGPSSSHTVGPMRAAKAFVNLLELANLSAGIGRIKITLCGSLGATGPGHGTPKALVAGLVGFDPATSQASDLDGLWDKVVAEQAIQLANGRRVKWQPTDIELAPLEKGERHPNAMRFEVWDVADTVVLGQWAYSVGGGFVEGFGLEAGGFCTDQVPHLFSTAAEMLQIGRQRGIDLARLAWENEVALHGEAGINSGLDNIIAAMDRCIEHGTAATGVLPGGLQVRRRAASLAAHLQGLAGQEPGDHSARWLQVFALATAEQNAAGGQVVTAPTNGAAGVVPAVMTYARRFTRMQAGVKEFLLVAGLIGGLYKMCGSISGAEAGCQGELGVAASMAAGALAHVLGATANQVENAAEIAMEHNLGLTCDPVAGLVQLPCIERNAMAAGVAVGAAQLALAGDGEHRISLDTVIKTMVQTGRDMSSKYKETSLGGLAVSVVEC